ncbi:MAG TPA: hypothetical protein IGS17_01575 [Oscillatoriales cyanobacterium M59_W2019_021]|nr:hypothetical protein [Oscillatoriales cyanobacterium M4454_W2019_049]HIK49605.1 hypothetical protein [Oscillatoriales cyanobacterium M59_W2019_021]
MSSVFVIALITAIIAGYIYLNVTDEIPRISALGIATLCFVLDLILAPWPVQLIVLTLVLTVPNKLLASTSDKF